MKKRAAIGIGISIIVIAIIIGIASLPEKILIENPSLEKSKNLPQNEEQIKVPIAEPAETEEEKFNEESLEKHVIQVEISDGIGSGDK